MLLFLSTSYAFRSLWARRPPWSAARSRLRPSPGFAAASLRPTRPNPPSAKDPSAVCGQKSKMNQRVFSVPLLFSSSLSPVPAVSDVVPHRFRRDHRGRNWDGPGSRHQRTGTGSGWDYRLHVQLGTNGLLIGLTLRDWLKYNFPANYFDFIWSYLFFSLEMEIFRESGSTQLSTFRKFNQLIG